MSFHVERHNSKLEKAPRAARACLSCHARKVRCDVSISKPQCTNCHRDGNHCEPRTRQGRHKVVAKTDVNLRNPSNGQSARASLLSHEWTSSAQHMQLGVTTQDVDQTGSHQVAWDAGLELEESYARSDESSLVSKATKVSDNKESGFMERSSYIAPDKFRAEDGSTVYYTTHISSEINRKILDMQKATELPPRTVRDALFENFWTYCYPWDPIVEKSQIVGVSIEKLSPLLLQAIFLAGSRMSTTSASYATPQEFYMRAKTLFYLNTEKDPLTLLTAVSLLHWWNPHGPERVSTDTASFWCRVAVSLAQQMGLHNRRKLVHDESLRRRIWWSLVVRLTCSSTQGNEIDSP